MRESFCPEEISQLPASSEPLSAADTRPKQYLNAAAGLPAENSLGLEKKLYAPNEISTDFNNVFAISTYKDGKFESAYGGIESKEFVIERYSYYRISAWYNSESVEGGDGDSRYAHV